ncbi:hypothetical protein MRB53_029267 [Persea americana]|uniref:Uncharacterized protein n=1 Tax=Persea americana TaxID=3435 RepID=A0ACC2KI43_PERAE|nr:hypothetical protein MRB53_029267 [Persea americana]
MKQAKKSKETRALGNFNRPKTPLQNEATTDQTSSLGEKWQRQEDYHEYIPEPSTEPLYQELEPREEGATRGKEGGKLVAPS